MDPIQVIDPASFFGDGITKINENFGNLQQQVQTVKATEDDSGLSTPVVMAQGANNTRWLKPAGVVGPFLLFDHGLVIREDQYSETATEVILTYTPALPYNIAIGWNISSAGMTPPVALTQHPSLGNRYWLLPDERGLNPWIFYQGRVLKQGEFEVQGNLVILDFTPVSSDISAAWGFGGPGMTTPVPMAQQFPGSLDTAHFLLPAGHGRTVLVHDYGLTLDSTDYTVNYNTGIVTLNYAAAEPLDVTVSWGLPLDGLYLEEVQLSPLADGSRTSFILPADAMPGTLRVRARLADESLAYFALEDDYDVVGRRIDFAIAPPNGARILATLSTVTHFSQLSPENPQIGTSNQSVIVVQGVEINIDSLKKHYNYNLDQSVSQVLWLDGVDVVKTITYTYNLNGKLATAVEQAGGRTVTYTYAYDVNGNVQDVDKAVA